MSSVWYSPRPPTSRRSFRRWPPARSAFMMCRCCVPARSMCLARCHGWSGCSCMSRRPSPGPPWSTYTCAGRWPCGWTSHSGQPAGDQAAGEQPPAQLRSAVVIGTGLIGTSIALALREQGVTVALADHDPAAAQLAADIGAGTVLSGAPTTQAPAPADLAVLAVPPAAAAPALVAAQAAGLARWYTDVASVKGAVLDRARALGCDLGSFVPGHPLSGRERSGPAAARADLFLGRPWVTCTGPD